MSTREAIDEILFCQAKRQTKTVGPGMHDDNANDVAERLLSSTKLHTDELVLLLKEALLTFGKSEDRNLQRALFFAIDHLQTVVQPSQRLSLVLWIADEVDLGHTGHVAIFPFVVVECDPTVVSSATIRYTVAGIPSPSDVLSEPRSVLKHLNLMRQPGAALGGLICLGDRRLMPDLRAVMRDAPIDWLRVASQSNTDQPTLAAFQCWLQALEDCADSIGQTSDKNALLCLEERFSELAVGLTNLVNRENVDKLYDLERGFGFLYRDPREEPLRVLGVYSIESVAEATKERLLRIEALELRQPYDIPHLLSVLGVASSRPRESWSVGFHARRGQPQSDDSRERLTQDELKQLLDKSTDYQYRAEIIQLMINDGRLGTRSGVSHYFASEADALSFAGKLDWISVQASDTAALEKTQTWFILEELEAGTSSETFMFLQNNTSTAICGLALKYSDAEPGSSGRTAHHVVEMDPLMPGETTVLIAPLFLPSMMFFSGQVPIWSIDIVGAFKPAR